jgi:hypothetical protein
VARDRRSAAVPAASAAARGGVGGHPSRIPCRVCGAPLSVHQAARGATCDDPSCRRRRLLEHEAERRRLREQALRRELDALRSRVAAGRGLPTPGSLALALLPANWRPTAPVSRHRLRRLRQHLERELAEATRAGDPEGAGAAPDVPTAPDQPPDRTLAAGCAVCRGFCCTTGEEHAHLKAADLRGRLAERPELGAEALLAAYLAHVPARGYRRSCIYHAPGGCALPRALRSDVCNQFLCNGLRDLRDAAAGAPGTPLLVAATADGEVVRLALLEPEAAGCRAVSTLRARVEPPCSGGA